ncbi:MAG: tyrosine-type recombinase/integrase [Acholeplasma sp.]|nr:tyrosine-type recombinase/integrase [Acholeplasma sp.]
MIKIHPLENLIELYLEEKDIAVSTKAVYRSVLKQYLAYLKAHDILYPKSEDINRFRVYSKERGCQKRWIHHQIAVLKGLYQFLSLNQARLNLENVYRFNIMESIKNEKIDKEIPKPILSLEQAKHLILSLKVNRYHLWQYRDYAMIYLMLTTGIRSVEVRRAKKGDLKSINGDYILFVQGKGRNTKDEFVKISLGVKEAVFEYLNKRSDQNPYLFAPRNKRSKKPFDRTNFNGIIKRALIASSLEHTKITTHSLRHTAATLNIKRGGSLDETKRFLRHTNMSNTMIYVSNLKDTNEDTTKALEDFILGIT